MLKEGGERGEDTGPSGGTVPGAHKVEEKMKVGHDLGTELVPICLDVKIQGRHVREAFCIEPSADQYIANMAKQLCSEWQLNRNYEQLLFTMIKDHIDKFKDSMTQLQQNGEGETLEVIRLNFHLGQIHVKDQFVWDLADPDANPEAFAEVMCKDLELPRQFVPEIACRIREQIIELKKNGPSGQAPSRSEHRSKPWVPGRTAQDLLIDSQQHDDDATRKEEPQPRSIYSLPFVRKRAEWEDWGPHVKKLSDVEFKQMEMRSKKARLHFGHPVKPNGSMSQSSRQPTSILRTSSGGSSVPLTSKRQQQQQQQRIKMPQGKQKDSAMHMHSELSSPPCIPSPGTMVPMVPPLSAQQQRTPGNPGSLVRASPHYSMYNGGMQNPIGNQWTTPTSMNRIPMGTPGAPSHDYVDYMHLHAMQGLHEGRSDVVMNNGIGQQQNDRMQGTLGNLVGGGPYQNGGMMQPLQNGHTVMQNPSNTLSWVMNPPYNHMYR